MLHLCTQRDKQGNIALVIAKAMDDSLIIGPIKKTEDFHTSMGSRVEHWKVLYRS